MSYKIKYDDFDKHWLAIKKPDLTKNKRSSGNLSVVAMRFTSEKQAKEYIEKRGSVVCRGDENNSEKEG